MVRDDYRIEEFYRPLQVLAVLLCLSLLARPRIGHAWAWQPVTATVASAPRQCAYVSPLFVGSRATRRRDFVGSCVEEDRRAGRRKVPFYPLSYAVAGEARQGLMSADHMASDEYAPGDRVAILVDPVDPSRIDGPISLWADWDWLLAVPAAAIQLAAVLAMACGIAPWRSVVSLCSAGR